MQIYQILTSFHFSTSHSHYHIQNSPISRITRIIFSGSNITLFQKKYITLFHSLTTFFSLQVSFHILKIFQSFNLFVFLHHHCFLVLFLFFNFLPWQAWCLWSINSHYYLPLHPNLSKFKGLYFLFPIARVLGIAWQKSHYPIDLFHEKSGSPKSSIRDNKFCNCPWSDTCHFPQIKIFINVFKSHNARSLSLTTLPFKKN